jgi:hypothetical protein
MVRRARKGKPAREMWRTGDIERQLKGSGFYSGILIAKIRY